MTIFTIGLITIWVLMFLFVSYVVLDYNFDISEIFKKILKQGLTKPKHHDIIKTDKGKENKTMARTTTRGWYFFEDGLQVWVNGFSRTEKRNYIMKHGAIVRFIPTN